MKTFNKLFTIVACGLLATACYEDKGNYDYSEMETIEITMPENLAVMSRAENIVFEPKVVSSIAGELGTDNANYEYGCKINYRHTNDENKTELWVDIDPDKTKGVNYFADFSAGNYALWYWVTNKETGVTTSAKGSVNVISTTSEGWMVLSNVGADKKARLDVVSRDSKGNPIVAYGVLGDKCPDLREATQVVMNPSMYYGAEAIFLLSKSGGYRLNVSSMACTEDNNMKLTDFILSSTPGEPIAFTIINAGGYYGPTSRMCVTDLGNAYAIRSGTSGASFETPLNTDKGGNDATYQVAPAAGTSLERPGNSSCALLYDITNKRFVGWNYYASDNNVLFSLTDPEDATKKFSYTTGMTFVDMVSTRFSGGLVYTILEDDSKQRQVYGVNLSGSRFTQEALYSGITSEHFNDAVDYAFHSQYPFMFYCYDNKVYSYNLGTSALNEVLTLPAGEKVTMLKFNLFVNMRLDWLADHSDEFLSKQFDLIVGSTTGEDDGGHVRFYTIDTTGKMSLKEEYSGFGNVVDVTYREVR